jgi:hypothetical protein
MPALQIYDRLFFYFEGRLDVECEAVEVEDTGDPLPVSTIAKNFAGISPVPKFTKFNVTRFVATTDEGTDAVRNAWLKDKKVKVGVQRGGSGKVIKTEGFVTAPKMSSGASDHSKQNYSVLCPAVAFQ